MDEATRRAALAKLDAFDPRIGNPERYIDYSPVRIDRTDLLGNMIRTAEFNWNLRLSQAAQAGGPIALEHDAADGERAITAP